MDDKQLKKLAKLEQVLKLVDRESPTADEIAEIMSVLIYSIKSLESDVGSSLGDLDKKVSDFRKSIDYNNQNVLADFDAFKNEIVATINNLKFEKGEKGDPGEPYTLTQDDKDAIVLDVLSQVPPPKDLEIPEETPEETVDKVNQSKTLIKKEKVEGLADIERIAKANAFGGDVRIGVSKTELKAVQDRVTVLETSGGGGAVSSVNSKTGAVVLTTADIADSTNKRYITDAQQTVLGNTSGTNTGDQTTISGNAGTATALQTARAIYGNNFDGSAALSQIIASTYGGTGNGFIKFSGTTTTEKTKTLRDATDTILELGGSYTPTGTWTSMTLVTPALGTPASGNLANCTFPTLNQNTTGSAATLTTTRTIWGQNFNGSANVTGDITLGASNITLTGSIGATGARSTKIWATDIESTNMPTVGGTAILTSLTAPQFTTIELGAASDTTLSRVSAGVIAVEGATVATLSTAQTWTATQTEKQIVYTVNAITASSNAATVPITHRVHNVTNNSAATLTITMTTTSAVDGQMAIVRIFDASAVVQTIAWVNTENSSVPAPTASNGSTTLPLTVGLMYNSATSKWRVIAVS